ncbi:glycoside hydrolase family 130 protein [Calditrichota bacterium]
MSIVQKPLEVLRRPGEFTSDNTRVIARFFQPGNEVRILDMVQRVQDLSDDTIAFLLKKVKKEYADRHRDFEKILMHHFDKLIRHFGQQIGRHIIPDIEALSSERQLLIGAYFTLEYSVEAAALFNPSIVPHPIQESIPDGSTRFIMSFRATGEGHISSIVFRSGIIGPDCEISFDPISGYIETAEFLKDSVYDKRLFGLKLLEMNVSNKVSSQIFDHLPDEFTFDQLEDATSEVEKKRLFQAVYQSEMFETMRWLARSNYELKFRHDRRISERVIFPVSENEIEGIEDARFVRFTDDDGSVTYYATYTAYNGMQILPQLISTKDFIRFRIITLNGKAVQDKGMALFPRKVNGKYVMISRQDGINLHIMYSEHLHFWQESNILRRPKFPWEFTQIGNCGSPLETEAGWLLLTHGVGPMRKYCIGVDLLDLNNPSEVIASLDKPILAPNEYEREGYVPNVVYTCGYMIHKDQLIIPYAMSDAKCAIASISVPELLELLLSKADASN